MADLYSKIRKYIGPLELLVIFVVLGGVAWYLDKKETEERQRQALKELQEMTLQAEELERQKEEAWRELQQPVKMLDSIYMPYMVDSLCRYTDKTRKRGYITMTKDAPAYQDLCSTEKDYLMWIDLDRYFPGGQLVQITGIAQDEKLIQFHFTVNENNETLDNMLHRLDSTLQRMQHMDPNAQSR